MRPRSRGKTETGPRKAPAPEVKKRGPFDSRGSHILEAEWRASGLSMENFAKKIDAHRTSVFRWIHGIIRPDRDNIFNMERVLGIPARSWNE
jgi:ribosome-binding protein aMBF1 (putative translation factor)